MTKVPLNAIIEELVKLEPLVEAALGNELSEHLNTAKEKWEKKREEEDEAEDEEVPSQVALMASEEGGESEATVEGPSTTTKEKETTDVDVEETTRDDNDATHASRDVPTWNDENAEALYFLQVRCPCHLHTSGHDVTSPSSLLLAVLMYASGRERMRRPW